MKEVSDWLSDLTLVDQQLNMEVTITAHSVCVFVCVCVCVCVYLYEDEMCFVNPRK